MYIYNIRITIKYMFILINDIVRSNSNEMNSINNTLANI